MSDIKSALSKILGKANVIDAPDVLEQYSRDNSFTSPLPPSCVVRPQDVEKVQALVQWANQTKTPLVPVSSGPPHFHGDTVPCVPGAVIVDLSGMKKILEINRRNRIAVFEPGVTYGELQTALAKESLRLSSTLVPRANKSVLTSLLEREPRMAARYQWASMDPLRCTEIVFGDGNKLWSGSAGMEVPDLQKMASQKKYPVDPSGPGQADFHRFLAASQGSVGMATWASVKCEVLPKIHKLYFVTAPELVHLMNFTYKILRYRYADELFILNNTNLACLLGGSPEQIRAMRDKLPAWIVFVGIAGRTELPEERVAFQEKDIQDIAGQFGLGLQPNIAGISGSQILDIIMKPSREPYWKMDYKGDFRDVFFVTTLDKTPDYVKAMSAVCVDVNYQSADIGIYIQPRHQGVNCHCEFNIPFNPNSPEETARIRHMYARTSDAMNHVGAFYTRPYGIWADMAYNRDPKSAELVKGIKKIFDPSGIMNPGKLGI
jgi:FAD/FMN-containing dehydrogenase